MKRLAIHCLAVACCAAVPAMSAAQEPLQKVKALYGAAAYEDALAALDSLPTGARPEVEQYRVLSLTALGRNEEAQKVMEGLIRADPAYALDPSETPPRVRETFAGVRQKLLPVLTRQMYFDGRAALDRKDRDEAIVLFERLIAILDSAGNAAGSSSELRILADGFLDLARALPARTPPPTAPATATASPEAPAPPVASGDAPAAPTPMPVNTPAVETRPVALNQELPAWMPGNAVSRRGLYNGSVRVRIGIDGRVQAADIVKSVHPTYDSSLLRAARGWRYEPATRNGTPVMSELTVEVNLRPPQ